MYFEVSKESAKLALPAIKRFSRSTVVSRFSRLSQFSGLNAGDEAWSHITSPLFRFSGLFWTLLNIKFNNKFEFLLL